MRCLWLVRLCSTALTHGDEIQEQVSLSTDSCRMLRDYDGVNCRDLAPLSTQHAKRTPSLPSTTNVYSRNWPSPIPDTKPAIATMDAREPRYFPRIRRRKTSFMPCRILLAVVSGDTGPYPAMLQPVCGPRRREHAVQLMQEQRLGFLVGNSPIHDTRHSLRATTFITP
jgi:hypothetical protein